MSGDKFQGDRNIKQLSAKDFDKIESFKLVNKDCCLVVFYSPTCPHCINMQDEFIKFAKKCKFMDVCAFDTKKNIKHYEKIRYDMPSLIQGVPTFIFYKNGEPIEQYKDDRTEATFLSESMRMCKSN